MHFNNHYELKEDHAFLSPSKSSWVNYTPEQLRNAFLKAKAKEIENVKNYIEGHEIIKEIVVPKKLVSIVIK